MLNGNKKKPYLKKIDRTIQNTHLFHVIFMTTELQTHLIYQVILLVNSKPLSLILLLILKNKTL